MAPVEEMAMLDFDRSNKGASKQRRDQINAEIATMRDLLPLPESSRQRLSQLQIMSLTCVYVRKCNILHKLFRSKYQEQLPESTDFFQALSGFVLVTTRSGKLLYISENVTDYLGHSMVDMKTQGDSLYDIVDKRDHSTVQAQLLQGASAQPGPHHFHHHHHHHHHHHQHHRNTTTDKGAHDGDISFFCRMNMSRTLKRQSGFGDVKVMHVRGHFITVRTGEEDGSPGENHCVFMATCSPLITPELKETLVQSNTMVFKTVHKLDMTFIEMTKNGEDHLGHNSEQLSGKSWYSFLHPEDIHQAKEKHVQLIQSNHEMGCMVTLRMIRADGSSFWVNSVMQVRQASLPHSDEAYIICINQVIDENEAYQIKLQAHMFFSVYPSRAHELWSGQLPTISPIGSGSSQEHGQSGHLVSPPPQSGWDVASVPMPAYHNGSMNGSTAGFAYRDQRMMSYSLMISQRPQHPVGSMQAQTGAKFGCQAQVPHQDQLKAMLKRKIQGPPQQQPLVDYTPAKIPKLEVLDDSYRSQGKSAETVHDYRNMMVNATFLGPMDSHTCQLPPPLQYKPFVREHNVQVMQVSQPQVYTFGSKRQPLLDFKHGMKTTMVDGQALVSSEQVVPDVNVPDSYLTPDPSPASSPQPSTNTAVKQEMLDEVDSHEKKASVNILQALEKLAAMPDQKSVASQKMKKTSTPVSSIAASANDQTGQVSHKRKELPCLDPSEVDNYFATFESPAGSSEESDGPAKIRVKQEARTEFSTPAFGEGSPGSKVNLTTVKYEALSPPTCALTQGSPSQSYHQDKEQSQAPLPSYFRAPPCYDDIEQLNFTATKVFSPESYDKTETHTIHSPTMPSPNHSASSCSPLSYTQEDKSWDDLLDLFSDEVSDLTRLRHLTGSQFIADEATASPQGRRLGSVDHFQHPEQLESAMSPQLQPSFGELSPPDSLRSQSYKRHLTAELSPSSSTSSLVAEDDMLDDQSSLYLEQALDVFMPGQRAEFSLTDRDLTELDIILDSFSPAGSLEMIKHGQ